MYYQDTQQKRHDRLGFALFLAGCMHLAILLGVSFDAHRGSHHPQQLAVTLATRVDPVPSDAEHVAQSNQLGSGELAEQDLLTSDLPPVPEQISRESPKPLPKLEQELQQADAAVVTSTSEADQQLQKTMEPREAQPYELDGISPEVDRLSYELASLQAELAAQNQAYARIPRVKRLTSVAARASADAAYLNAWRTRVETVGNQYYPEASVRYGIYGSLRLLVVIRQDGSLEDIEVLSSSGHTLLDEAAVKIVQLAAPFAPFPQELRATADKLEIIRTWQFQENRLSSG